MGEGETLSHIVNVINLDCACARACMCYRKVRVVECVCVRFPSYLQCSLILSLFVCVCVVGTRLQDRLSTGPMVQMFIKEC